MARKKTDEQPKKAPPAKKSTGTAAKKSTPAKRSPAKAPATSEPETRVIVPDQSDHRRKIMNQIFEIAAALEDDGLELLLEQAKVVEYKGKIEKFNRRLNVAAQEAIQARRETARPDYSVAIERTEDDFFVIQLDQARVFFNINEMRELTRVCHKAKDQKAGARNLFRWFERERSDLLADAGISSNRSPYLLELYDVIVSTYKVKA